jgi:hypothetical protein
MPSTSRHDNTKKRDSAKAKTKTAALPGALVRRAAAAATAKHARLLREARELLALISRRKKEITEAFYEIGEALAKLKQRDMIEALGRKTFAEVCEKDAGLSAATGQQLVEVATSMTREEALAMGSKKATAMVALARATPEHETPAGLYRHATIALPDGTKIAPATANELTRAAAAVRHAQKEKTNGKAPQRGRTTSAEERELADLLQRRLRKLGLDRAVVTAVATKPGQGADLRFEHIPAAKVDLLSRGIAKK